MKRRFYIICLLTLVFFLFDSCERSRSHRNATSLSGTTPEIAEKTELKFDDSICEKLSCDYCVLVFAITDGDTFKGLTKDKEEIKFRIYGIDAPEKKQAFGTKSKEYLSDLIYGQTVGIKVDKKDRYGRSVVWIFTSEGKDVSAEMLKTGMAWHYKKYDDSRQYADFENEAHRKKIGLWADANPIEPWNFRK
jgi:endonuclease YncB( thermonuclease family)